MCSAKGAASLAARRGEDVFRSNSLALKARLMQAEARKLRKGATLNRPFESRFQRLAIIRNVSLPRRAEMRKRRWR